LTGAVQSTDGNLRVEELDVVFIAFIGISFALNSDGLCVCGRKAQRRLRWPTGVNSARARRLFPA
jgi:hypothetical protein